MNKLEDVLEKVRCLITSTYDAEECGYTEMRSEGNSSDVFQDGYACGQSMLAYQIAEILGMELPEPYEDMEEY